VPRRWSASVRSELAILSLCLGVTSRSQAQCPDGSPPPCPATARRISGPSPSATSLAVLYFDNLSPDTADAYLADGLTEEITSRLGDVGRLRVTSRYAVRRLRSGVVPDVTTAGRVLGVRYLVEGSVRHAGGRVRVSTRLIDTRTGFRVWGADYDRATRDLLALQEDIAREVAIQIAGRLLPKERAALATRRTESPDAYDHFLRGNYFLAHRTQPTMLRAIDEYEAAARLDPGFTAALARVAYAYALYVDWEWPFPGLPAESLLARGFAAADRVLAADSSAADAWMARGYLLAQRNPRTLQGVREAFERAIALESENAEAWHQYGWFLELEREPTRAIESFRRALAIDPERAVTWYHLAWVTMTTGRTGDAEDQLDSAVAFDPSSDIAYCLRAIVDLRRGNVARGRDDALAGIQLAGDERFWGEAPLAMAEARMGDSAAARARANALAAQLLATDQPVGIEAGWLVGSALVAVGERARAIDLIERVRPRSAHLWNDLGIAELDPIRNDPRFQAILAESRWPGSGGGH
jgi:TolB-like protein/Tfp pilus assembly protein PilF